MPHLSLNRKLKPAKRAWRSFTSTLRSKFQILQLPSSIRRNTSRVIDFFYYHLFIPFKRRFLSKPPFRGRHQNYRQIYQYKYEHQHQHQHQHQVDSRKNASAIYIDKLYGERETDSFQTRNYNAREGTSRRGKEIVGNEGKQVGRVKDNKGVDEEGVDTLEDAWRVVVAQSPHLRPVDERADEFIYKFREEMKLEKERSFLEFQERIKRSA